MTPEPLKPGTTFWHMSGTPRVFVEVEVGEAIPGPLQRYRYRRQDDRWRTNTADPMFLWRLHNSARVDPPPPIAYTLESLVRGVMAGRVCTEGLVVNVIGNDAVYVDRGGVQLWEGDGTADVFVELLTALGVPAERA